jgi:RNA methyltransferase, RsmE family
MPGLLRFKKRAPTFLLEKATELGVTQLFPLITDRTVVRIFSETKATQHLIQAAEQSERLTIPTLNPLMILGNFLETWPRENTLFFCKERSGSQPLLEAMIASTKGAPSFLIGPEGGFTEEEKLLIESYPFVVPVSLGYQILRAETAGITALAYAHHFVEQKGGIPHAL